MKRLLVYVAAPLTDGGRLRADAIALNADRAAAMGATLLKSGFAPLLPHLSAGYPCLMAVHWALWIDAGCAWIEVADAVLRLEGASQGTEQEVAYALANGIPVFTSLRDLIDWRDRQYAAAG